MPKIVDIRIINGDFKEHVEYSDRGELCIEGKIRDMINNGWHMKGELMWNPTRNYYYQMMVKYQDEL